MIHNLRVALNTPLRISFIKVAMKVAWWLARPSIFGVKILEHYDIIMELKSKPIGKGAAHSLERGTLLVNCHEVMHSTSNEQKAIDDLEQIMNSKESL